MIDPEFTLELIIELHKYQKIGVLFFETEEYFNHVKTLERRKFVKEVFPFKDKKDIEYLKEHGAHFYVPLVISIGKKDSFWDKILSYSNHKNLGECYT